MLFLFGRHAGGGARRGSCWGGRPLRGRLCCGARAEVARPNSLRSLRSLRSDNGRGSVYEARCACRPRHCAPRHPTNRPAGHRPPRGSSGWWTGALGHGAAVDRGGASSPQPRGAPPLANRGDDARHFQAQHHRWTFAQGRAGRLGGACGAPSSAGRVARARSAPQHLTRRRVFERRWQRHRSELRGVGHSTEQRRAVGAQHRPRKLSPRAGPHGPAQTAHTRQGTEDNP